MGAQRVLKMMFLITALICFLGIYCGVAVGKIAEEELDDGKKYFVIIGDVILGGLLFFITAFVARNIIIAGLVSVIGFLILRYLKLKLIRKILLVYILLGVALNFGYQTSISYPALFTYPAIATLVFLYGFPAGSLLLQKKIHFLKVGVYAIPLLIISFIASLF